VLEQQERFSDLVLMLRGRIGITQRELATRVGVNVSSIQGWEAGSNYPGVASFKALITACLHAGGFSAGHEGEEVASLWAAAVRDAPRFRTPFDSAWFEQVAIELHSVRPFAPSRSRQESWSEAPDTAPFVGRVFEREMLRQWVVQEHARFIAVLGLGGIGKSLLATRVAQDLAPLFERVFWRSLRDAPIPDEWLAEILGFLAPDDAPVWRGEPATLRRIVEQLRDQRCLLVLDNFETVHQPAGTVGRYRAGYERYGVLLRELAEVPHQSCVILTSREEPSEVRALRGGRGPVRVMELGGLAVEDGRALLRDKHLQGDEGLWRAFVRRYDGNVLALKVVGETIRETFGGSIADYEEFARTPPGLTIGDVRELVAAQIERISDVELDVLRRMAVKREPIGVSDLAADVGPRIGRAATLEALEGLRRRSLLENTDRAPHWAVHPVVLEYVTEQLIEDAARELVSGEPNLLLHQPMLEATAKDYVRRSQERLIARPLVSRLIETVGSARGAEQRLISILDQQRGGPVEQQGYGPGNVINLLALLRGNLKSLDLSGLAIRQAYLNEIEAQDTSLATAHLLETVLGEVFNNPIALALSADGAYLVAGTASGEVCRWRVSDRTLLSTVMGHPRGLDAVASSGDGQRIASGGFDGTIRVWEGDSGREAGVLQGHAGGVRSVALSADGRLGVSGGTDGTVRVWDIEHYRQLSVVQAHPGGVRAVALSSDGRLIASGGIDGAVRTWVAIGEHALATMHGHTGSVNAVALSDDGGLAISGSHDTSVRVWDANGGQLLATLHGHTGSVHSVALGGDGQLAASGSLDGTVRLWDTNGGRALATLHGHTGGVRGLALSSDGGILASGTVDGRVLLWETDGGRPLATLRGHMAGIVSVALAGDGRVLATGSMDGTVRVRKTEDGQVIASLYGHTGAVRSVALTADGGRVVSASLDGTIRLWEVRTSRQLTVLRGHTGAVRGVALSADGQLLASGGIDGAVRIWDAQSWLPLAELVGHAGGVWSVAFSGDGRLLASGSDDATIRLWDGETGHDLATLRGHSGGVWGIAMSSDGRLLASSGVDETVRLWDVHAERQLAVLHGHAGVVYGVGLSDDGCLVASSGVDGIVRLWDARAGQPLAVLRGHTGVVYGVALNRDASLVVSTGVDGTIRLWDARSGACQRILRDDRRFERVDITGLTGVTDAQWRVLVALGAVERGG
jgi:WD40 repeat protein/transcriptional regulator with XRE-family HTH domain